MATILGTNNSETLSGTANADLLQGLAGNDTLNAAVGDDTLDGGMGNDSLVGGVGSDSYLLNLGDGADIVDDYNNTGVAETNVIKLGVGLSLANMSISQEGNGNMVLRFANSPTDSITLKYHFYYGADRNISKVIFADNSELDISATATSYTLNRVGTVGNDAIYSSYKGVDSLKGGGGDDSLAGDDGNDKIWGEEGNDVLWGDAGNDMLFGGLGNDSLNGGVGSDTYMFNKGDGAESIDDYNNSGVVETNVIQLGAGFSATDLRISMEGNGNMVIRFNNSPTDSITIAYHYYYDPKRNMSKVIFADNSELDVSSKSTAYTLNSTATVSGGTIDSNYIGTDVMMGDSGNDTFYSNAGNDLLKGNNGHDYLNGENGNDELWGGQGNDTLRGGEGDDVLNGEADNDEMSGQNGNDTLNGGSGNDTLYGGDGNDTLIGGTGIDVLDGGAGDDSYYIDSVNDRISDNAGVDTVYIGSSVDNYATYGYENVIYQSDETLRLPYFIDSLHSRTSWSATLTTTASVSFSFVESSTIEGFRIYTDTEKAFVRSRLDDYAQISGLVFNEVTDVESVQMRFFINMMDSGTAGYAYYPEGGDVHLSTDYTTVNHLVLHEIGHALGLKHPHDVVDTGSVLVASEDNMANTQMSYHGDWPSDLKLFDIASIQYLYGVNHSARAGNDVYTQNDRYIWDGAGIDTLSLTTAMQGVVADLRDGAWDYVGLKSESILADGQFYIGVGTDIENAVGSQWNDTLLGNELDNLINGGLGNDILDGRLGNDTNVCNGLWQSYTVIGNSIAATVIGGEGTDTLSNIENICFNDVTVSIVDAVNDNPIGVNDTNSSDAIIEASPIVIGDSTASGNVLDNDTDADSTLGLGETKTVNTVAGQLANVGVSITGTYGSVVINANGTYTYTLNNNDADTEALSTGQSVSDNFSYSIIDAHGTTGTATLSISIVGATDQMLVESAVSYTLPANGQDLKLIGVDNINGTGNSLNNIITGNSGNNVLDGGLGADTLDGGLGTDTLLGGEGNDIYIVDSTTDTISDSTGVDTVQSSVTYNLMSYTVLENLTLTGSAAINGTGNSLNNVMIGNSGNNVFDGRAGIDTLMGGDGNDIYNVDSTVDTISDSMGIDTVQSSVTYSLVSHTDLENLTLTGSVAINGTGNHLDNSIVGNSGNNMLEAGLGADTLTGGLGTDTLLGGEGNDVYIVDSTTDTISDVMGVDTVQSSVTYNLMSYTVLENLTLTGSAAINGTGNSLNNVMIGNSGNNVFDGRAGIDTLMGGEGNDIYNVDSTVDTISDSMGIDTVQSSVTYSLVSHTDLENLTLTGSVAINGTGNHLDNSIVGNSGNNMLEAGLGADTLTGGLGTDTLLGGEGNDVYIVDTTTDTISDSTGVDTVQSSVTYSLVSYTDLENLTLTGSAAINGTGNNLNNVMIGNNGNNVFEGGLGTDTLMGGAGNDIYIVDSTTDTISDSTGVDTVQSSVTYSLINYTVLENLTLTGSAAINGTGNSLNNVMIGNSGNNVFDGRAGIDTLMGGEGNDIYNVDSTVDTISDSMGIDTVQSSVTYSLVSHTDLENLTLTGSATINGTGNHLNNSIVGNSGNNILMGGAGNDYLVGGLGNDTYSFGRGDGQDTVVDTSGTTDVLSFLSGVARDQLWFKHVGNHLEVSIVGTTDKMTVNNWYVGGTVNQVEEVRTASGNVLISSQVESLVAAMASFTPPSVGTTTLDSGTYASVLSAITTSWSS